MILNDLSVNKALLIFVLVVSTTLMSLSSVSAETANDRIIVKYRAAEKAPKSIGITSKAVTRSLNKIQSLSNNSAVYSADATLTDAELNQLLIDLNNDKQVEFAERDLLLQTNFAPNDPRYAQQWHLHESVAGLQMEPVWNDYTGAGVVVAVIDSGVIRHADLAANLLPGYDMISKASHAHDGNGRDSDPTDMGDDDDSTDDIWHGTHVAGTIAAIADNDHDTTGIAFDAKVVPVRAVGPLGGFLSDIADGIIWAAGGDVPGVPANQNPAQVINLSVGGKGSCGYTIQSAINKAVSLGATIIVSAGNDQTDVSEVVPASCNNVVTVTAVNRSGARAYYSNFGSGVTLAAAGGEVISTYADGILSSWHDDGVAYYEGTSMAAPQVAAVAALLYQAKPDLTPAEVMDVLANTARPFTGECFQCGTGIVDPAAALAQVKPAAPVVDIALANGVAADAITLAAGEAAYYAITVPADVEQLTITLAATYGDADIFVANGERPTLSHYDCSSINADSTELCQINPTTEGTYYVMVYANSLVNGAILEATYTVAEPKAVVVNDTPAVTSAASASASAGSKAGTSGGGGSMLWSVLLLALVLVARAPRTVK